MLPLLTYCAVELFALAGGGGSGGGGGGGGGSGGGSPFSLIAGAGAFGSLIIAGFVSQKLSILASTGVAAVLTGLVTVSLFKLSVSVAVLFGIGAVFGAALFYFGAVAKVKRDARIKAELAAAASADPIWDQQSLINFSKSVFTAYQADWSNFNLDGIHAYTTVHYFTHMRLMLTAMQQMGRRNDVRMPELQEVELVDINDDSDNAYDSFVSHMVGGADDVLLSVVDNRTLYNVRNTGINEYWHFVRQGNSWLLDRITQETENEGSAVGSLRTFAETNYMYYSLDMGRLLIPERGTLFGGASFTNSDINNHIIGEWQGLLVQMYTYAQNPNANFGKTYLIGQLSLPKSYGGIIVKRKDQQGMLKNLFSGAPKGYQQVKLEWPDFNKRYEVCATNMDKVTSFELLNPSYMAKLYDLNLPISIEVVDNTVYFFTAISISVAAQADYAAMLTILQGAFAELKM